MKVIYSINNDKEPLFSIDGNNKVDIGTQIFSCIEYGYNYLEFEATVIKHQYNVIEDVLYCVCEIELHDDNKDYIMNQVRLYNKYLRDEKN